MALSINTNVSSLMARRSANSTEMGVQRAIQRLSTGLRTNSAADDAAGLAIGDRMTSDIRGAVQAKRNLNDSISLLQVADGAMANVAEKLQRLRELAVQAGNATNSASDKAALQQEASQILEGITSEVNQTNFNGQSVFSHSTESIGGDENKRALVDRLKAGWLAESENLIRTYYGIEGDGAAMTIDVNNFTDGGSNVLAYVSGSVNGDGTWSNLNMSYDMADFSPPSMSSDRVVAHELVHAVMARSVNMASLPQWFVEGTAELIHGADDRLAAAIGGSSVAAVVGVVGGGGFSYESAYAASRYLHSELKALGVEGGIKGLFRYLDQNQAATLDTALNAVTGGVYANNAAFIADFNANGANYITTEMNLTNADTGGIGGLDADNGRERSATSVISDTNTYPDVLEGFAETFVSIAGTPDSKQYVMQVGENVGDTITVSIGALNASALGLNGFNLQGLAAINIMHVDQALEFVNLQRANVGASMSRLESASNVVGIKAENLAASRSRVRDADYAEESAAFMKSKILQESARAMMAQANSLPQTVLSLLR